MDTIKKAFDRFSKPDEKSGMDTAERMLEGEDPKQGVIAALYKDECEAVSAYEKAKEELEGNTEATNAIDSIISDEKRHEEVLKRLWADLNFKGDLESDKED